MQLSHSNDGWGFSTRFLHVTLVLVLALATLGALRTGLPVADPAVPAPRIDSLLRPQPLAFVPVAGAETQGGVFRADAVTFSPRQIDFTLPALPAGDPTDLDNPESSPTFETIGMRFLGMTATPEIQAGTLLPARVNRLLGSNAEDWQLGLPAYGSIIYHDLYPGIDLRYDGDTGHLKGTYIVQPGANPELIAWQYSGAASVAVDAATGSLLVSGNDVGIEEQAPVAWQESGDVRVPVPVEYRVAETGAVFFALPAGYDPSLPLIIDPVYVYNTIYNGGFLDHGVDITIDSQGNAYALVYTYDNTFNEYGFYVAKIAPDGSVLWTTYLGGSGIDYGTGIAVDANGDAYITGQTGSSDFPVVNAMQSQMNGPGDAFISRLDSDDGSLVFSTYFGGNRHEHGGDLIVGSNGDIYLTGATDSADFPTVDPIQSNLTLTICFCYDSFVTRLSGDGSTVLFSTYLGGSQDDKGRAIGLDDDLNIYFAGNTGSDDFPLHNALQATFGGDMYDAFAARIAADGSMLDYSTYLGGEQWDIVNRMAVDGMGNAFVTGFTGSQAYPTTPGSFQPQFAGGINACGQPPFDPLRNCYDVYVTKLAPDGGSFGYSTFIGGGRDEEGRGIAVDAAGNAYVIGYTTSPDFPLQGSPDPGAIIYIAKLDSTGSILEYVLGIESGSANAGHGIAVDSQSDLYVTGALNVPADLFVARIDQAACPDFVAPEGVGVEDLIAVAGHWDQTPADPGWDPQFDLNGDGHINIADIMLTSANWERMCVG
ncbi:MAG: SBBP repeat-containing protein [Anaerolineae bacterium]|nr:SBBP repeat-containing protein [Anaerolineae bacterium]